MKEKYRVRCERCGKDYIIETDEESMDEFFDREENGGGRLIQEIFPDLDPWERELIKSGVCDRCFKKMTGLYNA